MKQREVTRAEIIETAHKLGAELVGFAPVDRWREQGDLPEEFHPDHIWPLTKTVISLIIPSLLPTLETKISHLYRSQYNNTNSLLDEAAYRLAAFLNRNGHAAINICRDGYGVNTLKERPVAAFGHVWAGHYAGLGTIGWNHMLITKEYGPRHRMVSVLTALEIEGDLMIEKSLCNHCRLCEKACPTSAFSGEAGDQYSSMNKIPCANRRDMFKNHYSHCGFCLKVCPVGRDRKLYNSSNIQQYFTEAKDNTAWSLGIAAKVPESEV